MTNVPRLPPTPADHAATANAKPTFAECASWWLAGSATADRGLLSGFCPNGSGTHLITRGAGSRESRDTA